MITVHKLIPPENHTLFERFPELNEIWEVSALQKQARESYEEWDIRKYPKEGSGEIFSINKGRKAIGIIGWFTYDKASRTIIRLRYYGIVPSQRRKGYGEKAMTLFLERLSAVVPPRYLWLSESVSLNRTNASRIIAHFESIGFQKFNDPKYGQNAGCGPTQSLRIRIPGR